MTRWFLLLGLLAAHPHQGSSQPPAAAQPEEPGCALSALPSVAGRLLVTATAPSETDLAGRELLPPPGTIPRPGLASPTRVPWVQANGWRMLRNPTAKFTYDLPAGKGALGVAEAVMYGADALVKIDAADTAAVCRIVNVLKDLQPADLPAAADFGVVDDGSPVVGEVLNLLTRRNLLFERVTAPSSKYQVNVKLGTHEFPTEKAADPSAFALEIRRRITDERRSLRIYGSEVVIARLTADSTRARLHLLNYGGRGLDGLRIRLRGSYPVGNAYVAGTGKASLLDHAVIDGFTEFSMPRMPTYAIVDLSAK